MMAADAPLAHPGSLRLAQGVWVHFRALVWWLNGNFRLATVGRVNINNFNARQGIERQGNRRSGQGRQCRARNAAWMAAKRAAIPAATGISTARCPPPVRCHARHPARFCGTALKPAQGTLNWKNRGFATPRKAQSGQCKADNLPQRRAWRTVAARDALLFLIQVITTTKDNVNYLMLVF